MNHRGNWDRGNRSQQREEGNGDKSPPPTAVIHRPHSLRAHTPPHTHAYVQTHTEGEWIGVEGGLGGVWLDWEGGDSSLPHLGGQEVARAERGISGEGN